MVGMSMGMLAASTAWLHRLFHLDTVLPLDPVTLTVDSGAAVAGQSLVWVHFPTILPVNVTPIIRRSQSGRKQPSLQDFKRCYPRILTYRFNLYTILQQ